jgi:hypothetical protein
LSRPTYPISSVRNKSRQIIIVLTTIVNRNREHEPMSPFNKRFNSWIYASILRSFLAMRKSNLSSKSSLVSSLRYRCIPNKFEVSNRQAIHFGMGLTSDSRSHRSRIRCLSGNPRVRWSWERKSVKKSSIRYNTLHRKTLVN